MLTPILKTKLHIPSPRANGVRRLHLIKQLNEGLHRKLTLISAPAGFGKTTLVSEWVAECKRPTAWVSLDEGDNDLPRFLTYLVTALQTIAVKIGEGLLGTLQSPQLPPIELILTTLLNELTTIRDNFVLVLDDYHVVDSKSIDNGLSFLLEHLPPQIHLVIVTREDPNISLARLRAQGHLTELRATSLRFNPSEAAEFFNQVMGLDLAEEEISALETRTEGWIAGLQLAAISMQGHKDTAGFIKSFTGSHHFVMDYLVEEVLRQQPDSVQTFLLHTSILDRLCGPLCDAVLLDPSVSGKETLENLELANIFIIPLDNERCWYRYHHLFADLLRQRLHQSTASSLENGMKDTTELHKRASYWYEHNGLENEAFQHAVAANDVEQAARLVEGEGVPLHYRSTIAPVLNWLISLPATVLDARPSLWVMYASALAMNGQLTSVEPKLQAAESALRSFKPDDKTSNLVGHIAAIRATLASMQNQADSIIFQARRALKYLHPDNLAVRTVPSWALGYAYQLQGNRSAAIQAYSEAILNSQAVGYNMITIMAMTGLASIQESENQLFLAAESYQRVLQLVGDPPMSTACEAHLGLARISYEWNDMDAAKRHAEQSIQLGRQVENLDTPAAGEILLARLKINKGDVNGATALLKSAGQ
ncbi:MAG: AAA family ATPase, partial [Deltaproteobacteria bacterium]|nr:AAA family ATPase [Deltaproteobacteria bacterium]